MPRHAVLKINLKAFTSNLNIVKKYAPKSKIWCVIKANAYGHTIKAALQGLRKTSGFAVLEINEAIFLRENGWKGPILLISGFFNKSELFEICQHEVTTVIHSTWQIDILKKYNINRPIHVYLKLNSGMNRLGFNKNNFIHSWNELYQLKKVSSLTLMSHFAHSYSKSSVHQQLKIVDSVFSKIKKIPLCLANSTAILLHPETHKSWVRPGIILYGILPFQKNFFDQKYDDFEPVMTLESKLIAIQKVNSKKFIGYGKNYYSKFDNIIGIVSCGYADGYPYNINTSGTPVLVDGIRTQVIGSIYMDMLTVDLKPCPNAKIGSKVELWGKNIKINDIAQSARTTSYELMCKINSRVSVKVE
ncbi:PLP-binding alanine racemase 2 [Wigglesworthia glossinidia endosymbiont of Glossina morsitans morsitans (Yale colony)]|uniref:Alanine racemase n=1 Tax=Wigglesworthia glossinidia endosymbiont of Glossina morsitans morsitans (Yale colony) TaxID=1142511 RepID=H6Q4T9_WIGGL|nr:alanine racemase [Wigglesworthia glossinidia]AFA41222.1 PLP-binding alanine racemase 2 [Wigglesworthia glossinidia endosymbiont of Glossina morsitans morsitans (Yale colony)]